jgi:type II secretory pathway component PulF
MQSNDSLGSWSYFWALSLTIWVGLFAVCFGVVVPQFNDLFSAFGAELPSITAFVIGKRASIWPSLLFFFLVQLVLYINVLILRTRSARRTLLRASCVNIAIQLVLVAALYAPIFKLGSVV